MIPDFFKAHKYQYCCSDEFMMWQNLNWKAEDTYMGSVKSCPLS